jgi:hypothetical protein
MSTIAGMIPTPLTYVALLNLCCVYYESEYCF